MIAIGRDAVDMGQKEIPQALHFGQALPAQRLTPAEQEVQDSCAGLVGPEVVELFSQDLRLEQASVSRKEFLQLAALGTAHRSPATQQQPPFAASKGAHDSAGAEELLAADVIERCRRMLQDMKLVKHDFGLGQDLRHGVQIRLMHIGTDSLNSGALTSIETVRQQPRQARLRSIARQTPDLAPDQVREHCPEAIPFASLDLVGSQMTWPTLWSMGIPCFKKGALGPARLAPAHAVAHRRMAGWHRLTVEPNELTQAPCHPRLRVREADPLCADAACPAVHAPLPVNERHSISRPGQVVPGTVLGISNTPASPAASAAAMPPTPSPLDSNQKSRLVLGPVKHNLFDAVSLQPENPATLDMRSHPVLPLCVLHQEKTSSDGPMPSGIAVLSSSSEVRTHPRIRIGTSVARRRRPALRRIQATCHAVKGIGSRLREAHRRRRLGLDAIPRHGIRSELYFKYCIQIGEEPVFDTRNRIGLREKALA